MLKKFSIALHKLAEIKIKFEFKFKLQTKLKQEMK
jgi:hypothetical protein